VIIKGLITKFIKILRSRKPIGKNYWSYLESSPLAHFLLFGSLHAPRLTTIILILFFPNEFFQFLDTPFNFSSDSLFGLISYYLTFLFYPHLLLPSSRAISLFLLHHPFPVFLFIIYCLETTFTDVFQYYSASFPWQFLRYFFRIPTWNALTHFGSMATLPFLSPFISIPYIFYHYFLHPLLNVALVIFKGAIHNLLGRHFFIELCIWAFVVLCLTHETVGYKFTDLITTCFAFFAFSVLLYTNYFSLFPSPDNTHRNSQLHTLQLIYFVLPICLFFAAIVTSLYH